MANLISETGQFCVPAGEQDSRLDRVLLRHLGMEHRALLMRLIRKGNVRLNGKRCKPNQRVQVGDGIFVPASLRPNHVPERDDAPVSSYAQALSKVPVLFEDEHLLVVNKPAGMVVHGGSGHEMGLIEMLKVERAIPELRLAHRLDRDTSGVLLMAKTLESLRYLTEDFREREMDKTYLAWVSEHPYPYAARMTSRLSKGVCVAGERMVVQEDEGKLSVTDYQVIQEHDVRGLPCALLALKPHSGRTHQLRVQLQYEGHAILGDVKYASRELLKQWKLIGGHGLMLHAWRLRIQHPITGMKMTFRAEMPPRMLRWQAEGMGV